MLRTCWRYLLLHGRLLICSYLCLFYFIAIFIGVCECCKPWRLSEYSLYRSIVLPPAVFWVPVKFLIIIIIFTICHAKIVCRVANKSVTSPQQVGNFPVYGETCLMDFVQLYTVPRTLYNVSHKNVPLFWTITLMFPGGLLHFLYRWKQEWILYRGLQNLQLYPTLSPHYLIKLKNTRKLSRRKDDRAMRPIYGCSENFRQSLTTPTATFPAIFNGLLFQVSP